MAAKKSEGGGGFREALRALKKDLPAARVAGGKPPAPPPAPPREGEEPCFEAEMERLTVRRWPGSEEIEPEQVGGETPRQSSAPAADPPLPLDDETLFLTALGSLDKVFCDGAEAAAPLPPNRLKQLNRKRIVPEESLDLHGLTRAEALQRVRFFLEKASYNGLRTVLVITGKGKGSEGAGVLRAAVADFLDTQGGKWLSAWGDAPRQLGGEGALVVFLRAKPR
ncbi:MAG: Smr/MutS family protein [Deltaproteobacteria bacterium]|nr:Smr/MutS family protein [Deltaproteobacteria bacterium]